MSSSGGHCSINSGKPLFHSLQYEAWLSLAQIEELHSKLQPHLLRRLKRDVLGALPPKKEQIVRVELSPPQRALYKATLTSQFDVLTAGVLDLT